MSKVKSKFWLLVKIQLLSYYGINKALHAETEERKKLIGRVLLALVGIGYFCWISWSYNSGLAGILSAGGMELSALFAMMVVSCAVLSLVSGILSAGRTLFSFKTYDQIMSLPVSPGTVAASRIAMLYIFDLFFSLLFLIPAAIVYAGYVQVGVLFWVAFALCTLMTPVIPLVISAVIGTFITAVSTRLRSLGRFVTVALSFLFIAFCAVGPQMFADAVEGNVFGSLVSSVQRYYPPSVLYVKAVAGSDVVSLLVFVLVSAAVFALFCLAVAKPYRALCSRVTSSAAQGRKTVAQKVSRVNTPFMALYKRELRRFFSLTLLVTNTMFGMLFIVLIAAALLIGGGIEGLLGQEGSVMIEEMLLDRIIPTILGVLICMSCTTCTSVSLEGKQFWLLRALPVGAWTVLKAKIATNLTLTAPLALLCGILIAIAQRADPLYAAMLIVIPLIYAVYSAVLGLLVNLKLPKMDWDNETQVIKQSAAVLVGQILGALPPILFAVLAAVTRSEALAYLTALVPLAAAIVFTALLRSRGERYLTALEAK